MQIGIDKIVEWLNLNKLSLNMEKTNSLLFNIRNKNNNFKLNLMINNISITQTSCIKFLGVYIDEK